MIYKLIQWFKRNACKECDYYHPKNNVCQSKKCATCGCHPYVNWFDRHFCEPYKAESDHKCHTCKHYMSGEYDGSCDSYICEHYSNWEVRDKE